MYKKVSSDMNFVDREKETVKFWKENEIFEKSIEERKDDPTYTFYDGPPTANRTRFNSCYQRYDPSLPDNERS